MIKSFRPSSLAWFAVPLCAVGFLFWINLVRIRHVEHVSALGGWSEKQPVATSSSSEFAVGNRLIVPEHLTESYHWIAQTQRMLKRREWRVRHIDYENAPFGRAELSPSPYRWWLGVIAWGDHILSGRSPAQSVERAALFADPLLHLLLLLGVTLLVARRFGAFPAALISIGSVTIFPFATEFLPGAPDDRGLAHIFAMGSGLMLLAGIGAIPTPDDFVKSSRRWFFFAGVMGGLGLWISVAAQAPVLVGVVVGALLAAWVTRDQRRDDPSASAALPWRAWASGGAVTILGGYLMEFFPGHLGEWRLTTIHPVYGLAWLGVGELLAQMTEWIRNKKFQRDFRHLTMLALALAAVAALPVAKWKLHDRGFLGADLPSLRLTKLPDGAIAQNLGAWMARDGLTAPVLATLLPLLLIAPAVWLLIRRKRESVTRVLVALALGPVLVAFGFGCTQLVWWNEIDGLLLILVVAATARLESEGRSARLAWSGLALLVLLPGVFQITSRTGTGMKNNLSRSEVFGLVERDLAGSLALRVGPEGAVVLAPPNETTALCYYGGMRGIGTLSWENKDGVTAAMRILSAPSAQEAKALIDRRGITQIVTLSWDSYFDDYARAGTGQVEGTFLDQLRTWKLPSWLRPVAYQLPTIAGFEGQSVTIYEVVEDQEEAAALGRTAEYFIEMGNIDRATSTAEALRRFPADFGAWIARAEVEMARGDEAGFAKSLKLFQSRLATRNRLSLPWEQRVRLAVVLAKAKQMKLSREQLAVCLATADEKKIRTLSTGSLYRLLVLSRGLDMTLDPTLREAALALLPSDQRERLR